MSTWFSIKTIAFIRASSCPVEGDRILVWPARIIRHIDTSQVKVAEIFSPI